MAAPTTHPDPSIASQLETLTKGGVRKASGDTPVEVDLKSDAGEAVDHLADALKKVVSAVDVLKVGNSKA